MDETEVAELLEGTEGDAAATARAGVRVFDNLTAGGRGLDSWERFYFFGFIAALNTNRRSQSGLPDMWLPIARISLLRVVVPPDQRGASRHLEENDPDVPDAVILQVLHDYGG